MGKAESASSDAGCDRARPDPRDGCDPRDDPGYKARPDPRDTDPRDTRRDLTLLMPGDVALVMCR